MEDLDLTANAKKLPPRLQGKFCPHVGTLDIPQPNPLDPKQINISIQPKPCFGESCAVWDSCQGDHSPAALHKEALAMKSKIATLIEDKILPFIEKLSENRLFAGLFKS